jgi:hypothetical protein
VERDGRRAPEAAAEVSRVKARVAGGQNATPGAEAGYKPMGSGHASPAAVMVMPVALVTVQPTSSQYVTAGMQDLAPIWTTDGAAVPSTAPGRWGQLRAAGRP